MNTNKEELEALIEKRVTEQLAEEKAAMNEKNVEIEGKCANLNDCVSTLLDTVESTKETAVMKDELEAVIGELGLRIKTVGLLLEDIYLMLHKINDRVFLSKADIENLKRLEVMPKPETLEIVRPA